MSDYYFARENVGIPYYEFPDEFCESALPNIFSYPNKPIPLVIKFGPDNGTVVADMFLMPSFSLKLALFNELDLKNIFGVNWVDIKLIDKGEHFYKMMQLCNLIKAIDRVKSDFNFYEDYGDHEFICGMKKLVLDESRLDEIDLSKRLIFRDSGWKNRVFFHKEIVRQIVATQATGITFFSVDNYSEFA